MTVSLGAPRTWIMQEKKSKGSSEIGNKHKWVLENGSLLVMQGKVQQTYTHEIPKEAKVKDSRIVSDLHKATVHKLTYLLLVFSRSLFDSSSTDSARLRLYKILSIMNRE